MIEIAGGIILGVVGLFALGALLSMDWRSRPAPPLSADDLRFQSIFCWVVGTPIVLMFVGGYLIMWLGW